MTASALTEKSTGARILDGILAGGLFFDVFVSDSSGAFYASVITLLVEGILLFSKKIWKNYLQAAIIMTVCVLILLIAPGSFTQGKNLLGNVKESVVNSQYEKTSEVFTVEKYS